MKIKASYTDESELTALLVRLYPKVARVKRQPAAPNSPYKRAYIDLKPP